MKPTSRHCVQHRCGMASVLAISSIGLLAVVILALTSQVRNDLRRTQRLIDHAQREQIMLAQQGVDRDQSASFAPVR